MALRPFKVSFFQFIYHSNSLRVGAVILQNHFSASYMKIFWKTNIKNFLVMTLYFDFKMLQYPRSCKKSHPSNLWYQNDLKSSFTVVVVVACSHSWLHWSQQAQQPVQLSWTCNKQLMGTGNKTAPLILHVQAYWNSIKCSFVQIISTWQAPPKKRKSHEILKLLLHWQLGKRTL